MLGLASPGSLGVEFIPWITQMVEDVFLAHWVKEIEASGEGMLSPHTVLILVFLVNESPNHGPRNPTTH
jgi:hypothetical protein